MHSPGPWTPVNPEETTYSITHKYAWIVVGAEGCVPTIARCALVDAGPATVRANAYLIAAAPDLLDALEWIADNCKEWEIERAAIRAIAKAKGETP